jgi:hypothetical protein
MRNIASGVWAITGCLIAVGFALMLLALLAGWTTLR